MLLLLLLLLLRLLLLLTWHHPRPHQAKVIEFHDSAKQKEALQLLNRCSLKHGFSNLFCISGGGGLT
jgi:hypothetical protein